MKVFISWSGTTSRAVAEALRAWLPKVLQGIDPFVSAKDIDKGSNWTVELARELEDAEFGIICLAPDNLYSPWLNYEAGAITKSVDSRVCPVLFGVEKEDVEPPMSQLQLTSIDLEDFTQLVESMNKRAGSVLNQESVEEAVAVWWPRLQEALAEIEIPNTPVRDQEVGAPEPAQPKVNVEEMIAEILHRMREMDDRISAISKATRPSVSGGGTRLVWKNAPSAANELLKMTAEAGLYPSKAFNRDDGVEIVVSADLPEILPSKLTSMISEFARQNSRKVQITGENRTVSFEENGYTDEPPF